MIFVRHRCNSLPELLDTSNSYGVEIDIRSNNGELIINHDLNSNNTLFSEWIKYFNHKLLILNVKEDNLEPLILDYLKKYNIDNFFFLDQPFPSLVKNFNLGLSNCAIRVSEYEPISTAYHFKEKCSWLWIDCFNKFPLQKNDIYNIKKSNFKLCIVSPELQGRNSENDILKMYDTLNFLNIIPDAICTKNIFLWDQLFSKS